MNNHDFFTKGKKIAISTAASAIMLGASVLPTFAAGNSTPGLDRYLEISVNPNPDAQCGTGAGSGAFGYLGKDLNPGDPIWNGGNGTDPGTTAQTGLNNSAVCGNRQGNL